MTKRTQLPKEPQANGTMERAVVAAILEEPREALKLPKLAWLVNNAPRSVADPTLGAALFEIRRQGSSANVVSVAEALEKAREIDGAGRAMLLGLSSERLPLRLAEEAARGLIEARRGPQIVQVLQEAAEYVEANPGAVGTVVDTALETVRMLRTEGPTEAPRYTVQSIGAPTLPTDEDADELLRRRFLCRGGGLLLAASTGIGKSTLSIQFALCWALGRPCLGIVPARPLRTLYIQAENDSGDIAELREGVCHGLRFTEADRAQAFERVSVVTVDDVCGQDFIARAFAPLIELHKPDVAIVDPLLSYIGGDISKQETVSPWLRNGINPVLHRLRCGLVLVHHTNKPTTGAAKADWRAGDFAYLGTGSSDLANWARAVIAIRSIGDHAVFELRMAKRGRRVGWTEPDGTQCYARRIAHGRDNIFWRDAEAGEGPGKPGRKTKYTVEGLVSLLGKAGLSTAEWRQRADEELGMPKTQFYELKADAAERKLAAESAVNGKWIKT